MNITPKQLGALLDSTVKAGLPTLTVGGPGIGKSDIHEQTARRLGYDYRVLYPATLDPTDISGLPIPTSGETGRRVERLLDDMLMSLVETAKPTLVLIDELGQASPAMQAACAPILLARRVGKHPLPRHVTVCAATNRRADRAGASSILTHLLSRMSTIVHLSCGIEDWTEWALSAKVNPSVVGFLRFRPTLLDGANLESSYKDVSGYPCPRSWTNVSRLLSACIPHDLEMASFAGAVGEGAAIEFSAYLKMSRAAVDVESILDGGPLPKKIDELYAVVTACSYQASAKTSDRIVHLAERLAKKTPEFAAILIRDSMRIYQDITMTQAWGLAMSGPLGDTIRHV